MNSHVAQRPSPALIVAMIALVAALAGSASALPGKNTVDKNDIKKNAVKSKAIAKGGVKSPDLKDESVGAADLADAETLRLVGGSGEPPFANGGDGDCVWQNTNTAPGLGFVAPVGFYKDTDGRVHLSGVASSSDAAGGDGECGNPEDADSDSVIFALPSGYRPASVEFFGPLPMGAVQAAIVGDTALVLPGEAPIPPGSVVINSSSGIAPLSGLSFRAAGPAAAAAARDASPQRAPRGLLEQR